jgi:hypothetical protein
MLFRAAAKTLAAPHLPYGTFVLQTTEFTKRRARHGLAAYHVFALCEEDGGCQELCLGR